MATVGTSYRTILKALKQYLIDEQVLLEGEVYFTFRQNPPALDNKRSLAIVPLYQNFLQESTEGHGRCGIFKKARVSIYYRHEANLDQTFEDDTWLLDDEGLLAVLERVEDALDLWMPQDAQGAFLLNQPARALMQNEPRKDYKDHSRGDSMVEVEFEYRAQRTV